MSSNKREKMPSKQQQRETANFLRSRRDRLQPEAVGLTTSSRRRTPGLRREEVAMLAKISPEWYTWLEQARNIRPSQDTLESIARALKLEPGETKYLLLLNGYQSSMAIPAKTSVISPQLQRVLDRLECTPAYIIGRRWDILGWNAPATLLCGDPTELKDLEGNCLWQLFLGSMRSMILDWENHAKAEVAKFRVSQAQYADYACPWVNNLVATLEEASPEFKEWWQQYEVSDWNSGIKHLKHPVYGLLSFEHNAFAIADRNYCDLKLITYVPLPNTDTLSNLKAHCNSNRQ